MAGWKGDAHPQGQREWPPFYLRHLPGGWPHRQHRGAAASLRRVSLAVSAFQLARKIKTLKSNPDRIGVDP
jgi:hypothetical protein